jgi:pyruvate,orthophosphate dikinase
MKWVYGFHEIDAAQESVGGDWDAARGLLGGKGANLGDMTRIGIPVPPGFTVTTEACNAFLAAGEDFPEGMWEQVEGALQGLADATGRTFADTEYPLLLSCRSGAKFSMPGMMDTVLNIGMNDEVAEHLVGLTEDERFVFDSYRRLIQMFGSVVLNLKDEPFEIVLAKARAKRGVKSDSELTAEDLRKVVARFQAIVEANSGRPFPQDPNEQLKLAVQAVFKSWNGRRAFDYRKAAGIAHDLGTGVNIQTMVFGNLGNDSATGVCMSRNPTTGEPGLEGDFLVNAQGEDVVAGIRATETMDDMEKKMPKLYQELSDIAGNLEGHYREMQDMEFTVERGKLWILQTRDGKRTAQAAVRIAVEMAEEGRTSQDEAVVRVKPGQVDFFLHPQFDPASKQAALDAGKLVSTGLNVSPGAAVGQVAFDADLAERWSKEGKDVVMVRPETKPEDVHGMLAANGILTSRGGRTSHAALVARQFGKPAVVGAAAIEVDLVERQLSVGDVVIQQGEWISLDGTTGEVFSGQLETRVPDLEDPYLGKLLSWADEARDLGVWANADYPDDAKRAREYGAEGIGLCRTEHMFFESDRIPLVQKMITAPTRAERREALDALLPMQRDDFRGLFEVMDGKPVIIRLIDPPLHEFLPGHEELTHALADLKIRLLGASDLQQIDDLLKQIREKENILDRVESLRESNPMLGLRGVRLGIQLPGLTRMQVRAIFEAACDVTRRGIEVHPEVMIPLTSHVNELKRQRKVLEAEARAVMAEQETEVAYKFGTMIEIPRAALTADQIAEYAEFFSFGTNDLTQTTFGISRDDAESGFLIDYLQQGILEENPFTSIDPDGVGQLMELALEKGRGTREDLSVGICGEHGGDPKSIALCHRLGLNYVSCSPFRVPIARLAAAQAAIQARMTS